MPRYFFHIADRERTWDQEGTVLNSDAEARSSAIIFAGEWLADHPTVLDAHGNYRVEVTDRSNNLLFTVAMLAIDAPRIEGTITPAD